MLTYDSGQHGDQSECNEHLESGVSQEYKRFITDLFDVNTDYIKCDVKKLCNKLQTNHHGD